MGDRQWSSIADGGVLELKFFRQEIADTFCDTGRCRLDGECKRGTWTCRVNVGEGTEAGSNRSRQNQY